MPTSLDALFCEAVRYLRAERNYFIVEKPLLHEALATETSQLPVTIKRRF